MAKYCRLTQGQNNVKYVAETFDFNPFEWIPNDVFLQDCMECPDYIDGSYAYKDGKFIQRDLIIEPSVEDRLAAMEEAMLMIL